MYNLRTLYNHMHYIRCMQHMYIAVLLVKAYPIAMGFNYDITHGFITILDGL